jgi:hypothetical protein
MALARGSRLPSVLGCALLLGASLASCTKAGENAGAGPTIDHTPPTSPQPAGVAIAIAATVTSTAGVQGVALFYRAPQQGSWSQLDLASAGGDAYGGEIPAAAVLPPGIQYYLSATDTKGKTATGPADAPDQYYSVSVSGSGEDTDGPAIAHARIADGRPVGTAVKITATITDQSGVASAFVYYRSVADDGGVTGEWQPVALAPASGVADRYEATLPNAAVVPPAVEYYLEATDNAAPTPYTSTLPNGAPDGAAPYSFTVTPGDEEPPVITHTPIASGQPIGRDVNVAATVTDATGVASVTAYYRVSNTTDWTTLPLSKVAGDLYTAVIPASVVTTDGVDYYLEAVDSAPLGSTARAPVDAPTTFYSFTASPESCVVPPLASESFPGSTLPGWWRMLNGPGTGCGWQLTSLGSHSAPYSVGHDSGTSCDDRLVLPCLDLTTVPADGLVLDLWQYEILTPGLPDTHSLEYTFDDPDSTSPGPTWSVLEAALPIEQLSGWARRAIVIPPTAAIMGHAKVYLALRYAGDQADRWAVDDVGVRLPAPAMALEGLATTPETVTPGGGNVDVALTITLGNHGEKASGALTGVLSTSDALVTLTTTSDTFASAAPGAATSASAYRLTVDGAHATGDVALTLHLDELNQDIPISLYVGARTTATVILTTGGGVSETSVDLYLGVGADHQNPTYLSARINGSHLFPGTWTYTPDLSGQAADLPPSFAHPWFLKVVNGSYGSGTVVINQFTINSGTTTTTARGLPFNASAANESYIPLPTLPLLAVDGTATVPSPVAPGASDVSLTVSLRNDGATTAGPVTATIAPKDAATTAAVTGLDTTTAHAFGASAIAAGQKVAGTPWTFSVSPTFDQGQSLAFVLTATDGTFTWQVDVAVPVPWPHLSLVDWNTSTATADFDYLPDPGEAVGLNLLIQNVGTKATAGAVTGTLTWNGAGAPGAVTTSGPLAFSSAALAAGATATTATPFDIQVDAAAQAHTRILMSLGLDDGTNSWSLPLAIPLFVHLGTDSQNDAATGVDLMAGYFFCDDTDLIVRVASYGTFNPTAVAFGLVIADTSGNASRLRLVNGVRLAQHWASGWVADATPPASFACYPTSGTTSVITFQVKLADLTALSLGGKQARIAIESEDPAAATVTILDALPNGWDGADFTKPVAVTWP